MISKKHSHYMEMYLTDTYLKYLTDTKKKYTNVFFTLLHEFKWNLTSSSQPLQGIPSATTHSIPTLSLPPTLSASPCPCPSPMHHSPRLLLWRSAIIGQLLRPEASIAFRRVGVLSGRQGQRRGGGYLSDWMLYAASQPPTWAKGKRAKNSGNADVFIACKVQLIFARPNKNRRRHEPQL